MPPPHSVA
jgi:hypothetical protein